MRFFQFLLCLLMLWALPMASNAQHYPKDIHEMVVHLRKAFPKDLQEEIRTSVSFDTLRHTLSMRLNNPYPVDQWMELADSDSTNPVLEYFKALGIKDKQHIEAVILEAFRNYLNDKPVDPWAIAGPYQIIEQRRAEEDKIRFLADTLEGEYIPKDLEDCFRVFDTWWSDSTRRHVKGLGEREFLGNTHHGFGTGLRNGWQLWAGSRLSKYFNQMGIVHPDDMTGIILTTYHRFLTDKKQDVAGQVEFYKHYWLIAKSPSPKDYPQGVYKIDFNESLNYKSARYGEGSVHIGIVPESGQIWMYDYHRGWKKVTQAQLRKWEKVPLNERENALLKLYAGK